MPVLKWALLKATASVEMSVYVNARQILYHILHQNMRKVYSIVCNYGQENCVDWSEKECAQDHLQLYSCFSKACNSRVKSKSQNESVDCPVQVCTRFAPTQGLHF